MIHSTTGLFRWTDDINTTIRRLVKECPVTQYRDVTIGGVVFSRLILCAGDRLRTIGVTKDENHSYVDYSIDEVGNVRLNTPSESERLQLLNACMMRSIYRRGKSYCASATSQDIRPATKKEKAVMAAEFTSELPLEVRSTAMALPADCQRIYEYVMTNEHCRAADIQKHFGLSESTVRRHIRGLDEAGLVKHVGPKKTGFYKAIEIREESTLMPQCHSCRYRVAAEEEVLPDNTR